ncbi:hypothetical protein EMCG_01260 [[Emmonsia] crescens]|uniref:Uncharacterized protein n=1 Tax=[Emmonsia] crescens TaxID=73230 RepID=A0A0G2I5H3_9EURO|nr:hypothetical protein EMCG_01260 [Emmonsia crescens UAMH 3008]
MDEDGVIAPRAINPKGSQNRDVVIVQTRGEVAERACEKCRRGNGLFEECVVTPADANRNRQGHSAYKHFHVLANIETLGNKSRSFNVIDRDAMSLGAEYPCLRPCAHSAMWIIQAQAKPCR